MANNFIKPTTEATRRIVEASTNSGDDITTSFERMKTELASALSIPTAAAAMISPQAQAEAEEEQRLASLPVAPPVQSAPHGTAHTHERIIYPAGNDRYILTGFSEDELNQKESRIRAMYQ